MSNKPGMSGNTTDLIFPPRILTELGEERGAAWFKLVRGVTIAGENSEEETAFVLLMARLNNCAACNTDSFRSSHGCEACSKQALKRFRASDEELVRLFESAQSEVKTYLQQP